MFLLLLLIVGVIFLHRFTQIGIHRRTEKIIRTASRLGIVRIFSFLKVFTGERIIQGHIRIGKPKETSPVIDIELLHLYPIGINCIGVHCRTKVQPELIIEELGTACHIQWRKTLSH